MSTTRTLPIPARGEWVVAIAALAIALWVTLSTATWALRGSHPLPYWDAWEFTEDLQRLAAGEYGWRDLLRPANEHRIAFPRLWFILDAKLWAGQEIALVVAALAMLAALAWLAVRLALRGAGFGRVHSLALGAALVAVVCSGTQMACLGWSFGVQFMAHSLLPAVALAAVAGDRCGWGRLLVAILAALGATFSIASSLLLWPLLCALALWCRRGRAATVILAGSGALVWASYFSGSVATVGADRLGAPVNALLWSLTHLGSAWQLGQHVALGAGALGVLALLGIAPRFLRRELAPSERVLFAIAALWVLYSLAIGSGRWQLGREEALASRYAPGPLLFWALLLALSLRIAKRTWTRRGVAATLALLVALVAWKQAKASKRWLNVTAARELATLALWCGDEQARCLADVFPLPHLLPPRIAVLRAQRLSIFADDAATAFGRTVPADAVAVGFPPLPSAPGQADGERLRLVEGVLAGGDQLRSGRVAFVDAAGTVRGLASLGWPAPRDSGAGAGSGSARWFGFVAGDLDPRTARTFLLSPGKR